MQTEARRSDIDWVRRALLLGLLLAGVARAAALDQLVSTLERSKNYKVRLKAARELSRFEGPRAVQALVFALRDPHPLVRALSANALGQRRERSALIGLCALRRDSDVFVKRTAETALSGFGGEAVCETRSAQVRLSVSGTDPVMRVLAEGQLRRRAEGDPRVRLVDGEGETPRLDFVIRASLRTTRGGGSIGVECALELSVYRVRDGGQRSLVGSGSREGRVQLGTTATEAAIAERARMCMEYLAPVVYDDFARFLDVIE